MLVQDWKEILKKAVSIWLAVFALFCYVGNEALFMLLGIDTDPVLFWYLGFFSISGIIVGRIFPQDRPLLIEALRIVVIIISIIIISLKATFITNSNAYADEQVPYYDNRETLTLDIAVPLIARWEGLRLNAYEDIVGVVTICYGSTRGIEMGMIKTKEECDALLRHEVMEYRIGWLEYVSPTAYDNYLTPKRSAAYTSLAYNVGIRGAGRSTATKRLNSGNIKGGCIALGWWNKAGGRVIRGLANRRKDEVKLCLVGIAAVYRKIFLVV